MADPTPLDSTPLRRRGNRVPAAVRDSLTEDLSPLFGRAFKTATAEGVRKHAFPSRFLTALRASAPEGAGPGREDPGLSSASAVHAARHFPALIRSSPQHGYWSPPHRAAARKAEQIYVKPSAWRPARDRGFRLFSVTWGGGAHLLQPSGEDSATRSRKP